MPGIVRVSADNSATRLTPTDEAAIQHALQTGDTSQLTGPQAVQYAGIVAAQAEAQRQAQATQSAANAQQNPAGGYPAATTTTQSAPAVMGTAQQYVAMAASLAGLQAAGTGTPTVTVLRPPSTAQPSGATWNAALGTWVGGTSGGVGHPTGPRAVPIDEFTGEYGNRIQDPTFRDWLVKRYAVLTGTTPSTPNFMTALPNFWQNAGQIVGANPALAGTVTPEQWLDKMYKEAGGDKAFDSLVRSGGTGGPKIRTSTSTTTYTVTKEMAQAAVDQMSQALLGRMASDAELKKARSAFMRIITPTVSTTKEDYTNPAKVVSTTHTKQGVSPSDAEAVLKMQMQRGSEGMAFGAGKMFEDALSKMRW